MSIFSRHFCRTTVCWHNDFWKWRNDRRSERNLCNCVKKKNSGLQRGLNPWPRDTGAMLYQLSYEATDVGSGSIVGSYVPVKEMSVNDIWYMPYMNCGNEMKMKKWSSKWTQFMQLRKEACKKKFRTSTTSPLYSKTNHKSSKNHPECYICYSKFRIAWEFEISLVVFIPNIIANHAITYTNSRRFL